MFLIYISGDFGAMEWALSEAGNMWCTGRDIRVDQAWRTLVCGTYQRQKLTGTFSSKFSGDKQDTKIIKIGTHPAYY